MDDTAWDERYAGAELVWSAEPNRFLVAETETLPAGRAVDLACGEGRNAVWLAERGWTVTGVDFSAVGLGKARTVAEARGVSVEWVRADVTEFQPGVETFDLAVIFYLHLPAEQRRAAFRHAAIAVAQGGTLLVVGHDITNPEHGFGGPQEHAILYGPDDIVADLDGLGPFDIVKAERVRRAVATTDGERFAIDALVRAVRRRRGA